MRMRMRDGTSRVAGVAVGVAAFVDERAPRTLPPVSSHRRQRGAFVAVLRAGVRRRRRRRRRRRDSRRFGRRRSLSSPPGGRRDRGGGGARRRLASRASSRPPLPPLRWRPLPRPSPPLRSVRGGTAPTPPPPAAGGLVQEEIRRGDVAQAHWTRRRDRRRVGDGVLFHRRGCRCRRRSRCRSPPRNYSRDRFHGRIHLLF
jgi:hypothetical protein